MTGTFYPTEVSLAVGPLILLLVGLGLWRLWRSAPGASACCSPGSSCRSASFSCGPPKGSSTSCPWRRAGPPGRAHPGPLAGRRDLSWRRWRVPAARGATAGRASGRAHLAHSELDCGAAVHHRPTSWRARAACPGGREAGHWIEANLPVGARLLTLGPSMANVLAILWTSQSVWAVGQSQPAAPQSRPTSRSKTPIFNCGAGTSNTSSGTPSRNPAPRHLPPSCWPMSSGLMAGSSIPKSVADHPGRGRRQSPIIIIYEVHP